MDLNQRLDAAMAGRHQSTQHFQQMFVHSHLPPHLAEVSSLFQALVLELITRLHDGPELITGLRKLLEAKDACVRQAVIQSH